MKRMRWKMMQSLREDQSKSCKDTELITKHFLLKSTTCTEIYEPLTHHSKYDQTMLSSIINYEQYLNIFIHRSTPDFKLIVMFQVYQLQDLHHCYTSDQSQRYKNILDNFHSVYGSHPHFISRAPGRVNIIGSHIDYSGFGVLPAAIQRDCLIAVRKVETDTVQINHCSPQLFPKCKLPKSPQRIFDDIPYQYVKYFAAGYRAGVLDLADEHKIKGLQVLIEGNVPCAVGIASSSAFCVCAALVSFYANQVQEMTKRQFIERCIKYEKQVGTAVGGMDQSISVLGKKNCCLNIQFNPIRSLQIELPSDQFKFIIMNSLIESKKLNTAIYRFNKRVCECRLALYILSKRLKIEEESYSKFKILSHLQQWTGFTINEMKLIVEKFLQQKPYTKQILQQILEQDLQTLLSDIPLSKEVLQANQYFNVFQAAYHAYTEAQRVFNFVRICQSPISAKAKSILLGEIMNQGQISCRQFYKSSCSQIDQLTETAKKFGAIGSKLTGAGWGGCTVSLVPNSIIPQFIENIKKSYYDKQELRTKVSNLGFDNIVIVTQGSEGACIIDVEAEKSQQ